MGFICNGKIGEIWGAWRGGGVRRGGRRAADEEETVEFTDGGLVFYFIFMYFPMYNTRYLFVNKYSTVIADQIKAVSG